VSDDTVYVETQILLTVMEGDEPLAAARIKDLTPKELVDLYEAARKMLGLLKDEIYDRT